MHSQDRVLCNCKGDRGNLSRSWGGRYRVNLRSVRALGNIRGRVVHVDHLHMRIDLLGQLPYVKAISLILGRGIWAGSLNEEDLRRFRAFTAAIQPSENLSCQASKTTVPHGFLASVKPML